MNWVRFGISRWHKVGCRKVFPAAVYCDCKHIQPMLQHPFYTLIWLSKSEFSCIVAMFGGIFLVQFTVIVSNEANSLTSCTFSFPFTYKRYRNYTEYCCLVEPICTFIVADFRKLFSKRDGWGGRVLWWVSELLETSRSRTTAITAEA